MTRVQKDNDKSGTDETSNDDWSRRLSVSAKRRGKKRSGRISRDRSESNSDSIEVSSYCSSSKKT